MGAILAELKNFYYPALKQIVRGIGKLQSKVAKKKRCLIIKSSFLYFLAQLNKNNLKSVILYTSYSLVFVVFLRIKKFT